MAGGLDLGPGLRIDRHGSVAVVTIDRQDVLNALDTPTRLRLARGFRKLGGMTDLGAVILTGAGERAFTVGQDLREAEQLDVATGQRWMASWIDLYHAIAGLPVPSIAALNGVAAGAGLQLGLLCDIRIAASAARLGLREIDVGLPAITGFWLFSSMLGRSRAIELILTGRLLDASEASSLGMVHRVVGAEELPGEALHVARQLAVLPAGAMRATRRWIAELTRPRLAEASAAAARDQVAAIESGEPQQLMAGFLARARERRIGHPDDRGRGA